MIRNDPWAKTQRKLARVLSRRMVLLRHPRPMISFTFDDVPLSACTRGRRLMEQYGVRGTYYVCGRLTDQIEPERLHTQQALRGLIAAGHEVACHGFSHVDYQSLDSRQIEEDIERNRQFLGELGVDASDLNFAYPFGCTSPSVKRLVSKRYISARGVDDGLNVGQVDLSLLRATRLYQGRFSDAEITQLIEECVRQCAWLIFFTHGVDDAPDEYGCTPDLLEHALHISVQSGAQVLTVRDALQQALEQP